MHFFRYLLLTGWTLLVLGGETIIRYPQFEKAGDARFTPYVALLRTALDRTVDQYGPYKLLPSDASMNEARYLVELDKGALQVVWTAATIDRERRFLPIRIPLERGLLGYRVSFIGHSLQQRIDRVHSLDDLRKLTIGQGVGWGDVEIYNANGMEVVTAPYEALFRMVAANRFDLFPRGISEVFAEQAQFGPEVEGLHIEQGLVLYYPWPYYFFVSRNKGQLLATRIETGLQQMLKDGSYIAHFNKYYGDVVQKARLSERRIIRIHNPFLPKNTPLHDPRLWYQPE